MTANDWNVLVRRVGLLEFRDETRGTDDIEGGDTEQALGIVDALGFEYLGADRDGGVYLMLSVSITVQRAMAKVVVPDSR